MKPVVFYSILLSVVIGITLGVGGYAFVYAEGHSYLQDNPTACANCHVMQEQYDGWIAGSHAAVAGCNDCHTPPGTLYKYWVKAENGFWHSMKFTLGNFHEPIQIRQKNHEVTELACRSCHEEIVQAIDGFHRGAEPTNCIRCHDTVGHLR